MARQGPYDSTSPRNDLSYLNSYDGATVLRQLANRDPTVNDRRFKIGTDWINVLTNNVWKLTSVVSNSANWEPISQSAGGNAPISKFVVDADGTADYVTIQSAITAAGAGPVSIWIRPGTYTENLVFPAAFNGSLVGAVANSDVSNHVSISGIHTPPTSGSLMCRNIRWVSGTHAFSSAAAGSTAMTMDRCNFVLTNGAVFSLANWTGALRFRTCVESSTSNSLVDNNGGSSEVTISGCEIGSGGTTMKTQGNVNVFRSNVGCAVDTQTGSVLNWKNSTFTRAITFSNDTAGRVDKCSFILDGTAPITHSSSGAISLSNLTVDSNISPPIAGAGAGTLSVSSIDFLNATGFAATLTLANDNLTVGTLTTLGAATVGEDLDVKAVRATNLDVNFQAAPNTCTASDTGGVATGVGGDVNVLTFQEGITMEQYIIGTQTIIKPTLDANGVLASLDLTATDGVEYNFDATLASSQFAYTIGTSSNFYFQVALRVADISGGNPYIIGFRKVQANTPTYTNYTDFYALGMITGTSATNVSLASNLNGAGATLQDSGDAWPGGDGGTATLRVNVTTAGVVTATINGAAPSTPLAFTFDNTDVVCPFIHFVHGAAAPGAVNLVSMQVGLQ